MDIYFNTIGYCSVMVKVYAFHGYDFKCLLLIDDIGRNFPLTAGCATVEFMDEILFSKTHNDAMLT